MTIALVAVLVIGESEAEHFPKFGSGDPDAQGSETATRARARSGGYDAFISAQRTYPAEEIPPTLAQKARATFKQIAKNGDPGNNHFYRYGPQQDAVQPGVLAFTGATNTTASRVTALVIAPTCGSGNCRMWVGASGGGVWRTERRAGGDARAGPRSAARSRRTPSASLTADPNDPSGNTHLSRHGRGQSLQVRLRVRRRHLQDRRTAAATGRSSPRACVSNSTYACVTARPWTRSSDAAIRAIVVDPTNPNHIFVASALGVRGLSHAIGSGGTYPLPPNANESGVYESTDGGKTFTEVWDGNERRIRSASATSGSIRSIPKTRVRVRVRPGCVAALADARCARPRRTTSARSSPRGSSGGGTDRTMFALTVKNGQDADLPDRRRHRQQHPRRTSPSSGGRTTPTNPPRRSSRSQTAGVDSAGAETGIRSRPSTAAGSG